MGTRTGRYNINSFAALMTSYDVLDDVFRICRQDDIGRPASFLVSCARSGEPKLNRTFGDG